MMAWAYNAFPHSNTAVQESRSQDAVNNEKFVEKYMVTGDVSYLVKALQIAVSDEDKTLEGEVCRQLGLHYSNINENNKSIAYFLQALDAFAEVADNSGLMKTNLNLGVIYYNLYDLGLSLQYTGKAAEYARKIDNPMALSIILGNLGSLYEKQTDGFEKALACHQEALALSQLLQDTVGILSSFNNLGVLYEKNSNFEEAFANYHQALQFALYLEDNTEACRIQTNLASLHIRKGNFENALNLLKTSEDICQKADMMLAAHRFSLLSAAFAALENFRQAYHTQNNYLALSDSIFNIERLAAINEISKKYETEKKEQQIALLEKDLLLNENIAKREKDRRKAVQVAMLFLLLFLMLIFWLYYEKLRFNRKLSVLNQNLQNSEQQLKLLNQSKDKFLSVLSHDLRNPLSAFEKISEKLAKGLVDDCSETGLLLYNHSKQLGNLLNNLLLLSKAQRGLLLMDFQAVLPKMLIDEVFNLAALKADEKNILLQNHISPSVLVFADSNSLQIIFRNLIENAVKFTEAGFVRADSEESGNYIIIKITDSGPGIEPLKLDTIFTLNSDHNSGLGLLLCTELADLNHADISIASTIGKGTSVSLQIPKFQLHEDCDS